MTNPNCCNKFVESTILFLLFFHGGSLTIRNHQCDPYKCVLMAPKPLKSEYTGFKIFVKALGAQESSLGRQVNW
jgi:hypothetical protein